MVGKSDFKSEWGVFHKVTGDFEVATLIGITDTDSPDIKLCTFIYNEDNYKRNIDISIIDSWVEKLSNGQDTVIHSLTSDNKIYEIPEALLSK